MNTNYVKIKCVQGKHARKYTQYLTVLRAVGLDREHVGMKHRRGQQCGD